MRGLLAKTMAENNRSNDELSSKALAGYEAGSAYAIDDATYKADRLAEKEVKGFRATSSPFTVRQKLFALQAASAWPVQLLAGGPVASLSAHAPAGPACGSLLDFEKTASGGRWRIVLEPTTDKGGLPALAERDGYASGVSARTVRRADRLPGEVAKQLLSFETSGKLGPFTKSDFTGSCWQLPDPRSDLVGAEASGYDARDLYRPASPADTAVFSLSNGRSLVIFTLSFTDELVATSSSNPVVWTRPSPKREPGAVWTYLLRAGSYGEISEKGDLEVAVVLSPASGRYSVVGSYEGVTAVTGRRVKHHQGLAPGVLTSLFSSQP